MEDQPKLVRVKTAARELGVSKWTIYRLVKYGILEYVRSSPHTIRIYSHSLERLKENPLED